MVVLLEVRSPRGTGLRWYCTLRHMNAHPSMYSPKCVERLYGKSSNSGESPRHEADHGSVHHRFAARTKPLVVLAHPPLLVDPRQRTLHHPPTRQHQEAFGGMSLRQSTATPSLAHSFVQLISTSSGAGAFWGARRGPRSIPKSCAPNRRPCPLRGSPRPPTGARGAGTVRRLLVAAS